ncbi:MAG TPA: PQQ-binding-like beta-propeller repeat protein [Pyrinomonadaceae bacterium]|nr:PQQ-binding-like beta-propeller repeat protein [Pyrinomonadaceae bacterium]
MYVRPLTLNRTAFKIPASRVNEPWWVGPAYLLFALLIGGLLATVTQAASLWTHKPTSDIKWYRVTDVGSILIGSKSGLYTLDGANGQTIWTRNDLAGTEEFEVDIIAGTPLLFVSDTSGAFSKGTKLFALDLLTGQNIWETDKLKGATVAVEPVYEKDLVLLVTVPDNRANKAKPKVSALRLTTGEMVWEADYPDNVDLYGIERGSKYFPKFDLSGANEPLHDSDSVYFTYAGLHRYALEDGKLMWSVKYDVTEGSIKRGNAQALIDGETIYTSAKGQLRAIDKQSGAVKWTSKDFGGSVAELKLIGDVLYGRLGGAFYDFGKREYVNKKPFGVAAVNKGSGATLWYYEGAKESVTNMVVIPNENLVLLADAKNVIALDTSSTGKAKEAYKMKLEFKHNLGAAATVAKVAKFGFGGLSAIGSKGADTTDEPVALYRRENGTVVVQGKQHLLAFDPRSRNIAWSVKYEAPGVPGWQKIAMAGLTALAYTSATAAAANSYYGTSQNRWANSQRINSLAAYEQFVSKRYSATKASGNYVYVLTTVKEGKEKGAGLIGVHMETGRGDRQIMFKDKEPDYQVDDAEGRVFNLRNSKELSAFTVDAAPPAEEKKDDKND